MPGKNDFSILIVDDEASICESLKGLLKYEGYKSVLSANNGAKALDIIKKKRIDLLITDLRMPGMDGKHLLLELRKKQGLAPIPVILMSAFLAKDGYSKIGNFHYLTKPLEIANLMTIIDTIVNSDQKQKELSIDKEVINGILEATKKVFNGVGIKILHVENYRTENEDFALAGDVSSIANINSESFQAMLCLSFEHKCFLAVMSKMLLETYSKITDEIIDGVVEINKMITCNAKESLEKYKIKMGIPMIIRGNNLSIKQYDKLANSNFSFQTEMGKFFINIMEGTKETS